jgi:hypothetical protein
MHDYVMLTGNTNTLNTCIRRCQNTNKFFKSTKSICTFKNCLHQSSNENNNFIIVINIHYIVVSHANQCKWCQGYKVNDVEGPNESVITKFYTTTSNISYMMVKNLKYNSTCWGHADTNLDFDIFKLL